MQVFCPIRIVVCSTIFAAPAHLTSKQQQYYFADDRYNQLLFSYRARYFPESLSETEQQTWHESCRWRLTNEQSGYLTMEKNNQELAQLLTDNSLSEKKREVLLALQSWSQDVAKQFSL